MKKLLSIILSCIIIAVSSTSMFSVNATEDLIEYTLPVVSDIANILQFKGLSNESMMKKGVIMVAIDDVCKIADASIVSEDSESILVSRNTVSWCCDFNDDDNQYLLVDLNTGKGDYYQSIIQQLKNDTSAWSRFLDNKEFSFAPYSNQECDMKRKVHFSKQTGIEYQIIDNKLYVSFFPFLEMMGVKSEIIDDTITKQRVEILKQYASLMNYTDFDITVEDMLNYYKENTGCDTYISCTLGLPIDELYQDYYNNNYSFDMSDYFSSFDVACANIANSVGSFDGFTKTVLSASGNESEYTDSLISVITQKGSGYNNNDDSDNNLSEHIQKNINNEDLSITVINYCLNQHLNSLNTISDSYKTKLLNTLDTADKANTGFLAFCSGCVGYIEAADIIDKVGGLFGDEQYILKESILSSEQLKSRGKEEERNNNIIHYAASGFFGVGNIYYGLYRASKINNSYISLLNSSEEVQSYIEKPETMQMINAFMEGMYSLSDDLILGTFDEAFCGGIPVSQLCCTGFQIASPKLQEQFDSFYFEPTSDIANIDDYVFIQDVAEDCFFEKDYILEDAYYSFILGVKATLTAYITHDSHQDKQRDLEWILSDAVSANRGYFQTNLQYKPDLSEFADIHVDLREISTSEADDSTQNSVNNDSKWRELYEQQVKDLVEKSPYNSNPSQCEFMLYDLNNDNCPELIFIEPGGYTYGYYLYTISKNQVISLDEWSGEIEYNQTKNTIIRSYNSDGSDNRTDIGYTLDGETLKEQFKLFYNNYDFETRSLKYTYQFNGEDISEQQYHELFEELVPSDVIHVTKAYDIKHFTADETGLTLAFHPEKKVKGKVITQEDDLNVRNEPNAQSDIIGKLPKGLEVEIVACPFNWYQIDYNGQIGFVSKDYVSLITDIETDSTTETTESEIIEILYNETKMKPVKYYYDNFEGNGTLGIIAIYQYEGDYSENDNCQVWYSDGRNSKCRITIDVRQLIKKGSGTA